MKKLLILIALYSSIASAQTLYNPVTANATDSIIVPTNVGGVVRRVYNVDLGKNKVSLSSGSFSVASDSYINGVRIGKGTGLGSTVLIGLGTAGGAFKSDSVEHNVVIGYDAAKGATGLRESVVIGSFAYSSFVNQGNFVEDGLSTVIGASAAGSSKSIAVIAIGQKALCNDTLGLNSVVIGTHGMNSWKAGIANTSVGSNTGDGGVVNMYGNANSFFGNSISQGAGTKTFNTLIGAGAGNKFASGVLNTHIGYNAGFGPSNYDADFNTSVGAQSMFSVATGSNYNASLGYASLYSITTGRKNIEIGGDTSTVHAYSTVTTGSNNIKIGWNLTLPSSTADNQLNIGDIIQGTTGLLGNVGIGTASPTGKLNIVRSNATTANDSYGLKVENYARNVATDGTTKYGLFVTASDDFRGLTGALTYSYGIYDSVGIGTAGADFNYPAVFMGGNVGIGVSRPLATFHSKGGNAYFDATGSVTNYSSGGASNYVFVAASSSNGLKVIGQSGGTLSGQEYTDIKPDAIELGLGGAGIAFYIARNNNGYSFNNNRTDDGLYFQNGGSTKLFVGSSIGIGTTSVAATASLDITSTTKGFLPPRMTSTQGSAISSPAEGLLIYVTDTNGTFTAKGWWGYDGAAWQKLNN